MAVIFGQIVAATARVEQMSQRKRALAGKLSDPKLDRPL